MSHLLWKFYWEDDVDRFRRLLAPAGFNAQSVARSPNVGHATGSPKSHSTSPLATKWRKPSGHGHGSGGSKHGGGALGKAEINSRDHAGLTVLLRAAASTTENAFSFAQALVEHPSIDIYMQDPESGWNALHRALYAGNISIARLLLEKERKDLTGHSLASSVSRVGQLIKTKDNEGNSPFDVYNKTIALRDIKAVGDDSVTDSAPESDSMSADGGSVTRETGPRAQIDGDEVFAFGSNRNFSLGLGDEDDRQYPERVHLRRPDHLFQRFFLEYQETNGFDLPPVPEVSKLPAMILNRPLIVRDAVLAKFHSAIITADPCSNLYMCGIGRGGRLGLGDENTQFNFVPVQGGLADKKVVQVALGQNHSLAVTGDGGLWTWGSNSYSQLGYSLPESTKKDETPFCSTPRQLFGPLKKEAISGVAASGIHSVAHTLSSLYTWGKNVGQLGLMDADSRSLDVQTVPRKVAASLFQSPIVMVSAIDKATTCLLANHTVCVFTGYGYNIVKFPVTDTLANQQLSFTASTRYEGPRNLIESITSGGETIAAVNSRGDLFTMNLDHKIDTGASASSTTNPSKIKGAVTQPQCVWNARKEGVKSVGVGEHGSVIFSTKSGAVWRRVKRAKAKDAYGIGSADARKKDFKFQRVPYITNVVSVRASPFGAFAAIRRDCEVMREQLSIEEQGLWTDIAPLMCLQGFRASEPSKNETDTLKFWDAAVVKERLGPVAYEILRSPNLDADLEHHLTAWKSQNEDMDVLLCTSEAPSLKIPAHGWILAARSPVLRRGLAECRTKGSYEMAELFHVENFDGQVVVKFDSIDIMCVLNLAVYAYTDKVIPAWNFTRQAPPLAYRYRQIRTELMKMATRLTMPKLEAAVRIQTHPEPSLDADLAEAIRDRVFFNDADALLELDGAEFPVHSQILCQRCPWFEGLFHGRSGGCWLAGRRQAQDDDDELVRIDLKHLDPEAFRYVLRWLYSDTGENLFDMSTATSFDEWLDLIMDVLSIANELMLDRLSQICQQVVARFVNTRSIAYLLNEISPCTVTEFKDAGLEYIALQMECMLENHLLDDLDTDLLMELDEVVRGNQLACLPISKSNRAELLLHEKYPELAQDIDEERQIRVKEVAFKVHQRDDERKLSTSFKGKGTVAEELGMTTPTSERVRRSSRTRRNEPFSPNLRPKELTADFMFDMDEEMSSAVSSPLARPHKSPQVSPSLDLDQLPSLPEALQDNTAARAGQSMQSSTFSLGGVHGPLSLLNQRVLPSSASAKHGNPWAAAPLPTAKLDLREIMSEAVPTSALSTGLAAQKAAAVQGTKESLPAAKPPQTKLSQKERKRQQLQATQASRTVSATESKAAWDGTRSDAKSVPWKTVTSASKPAMKDAIASELHLPVLPPTKPLVTSETSKRDIPRRTASPDTRFSGQSRTPSSSKLATPKQVPAQATPTSSSTNTPLIPHSKSYMKPVPKLEPTLGLSLADIIGQQKREQEVVKEAVAKRSLQEIQQEQAFQEWWDQESRRTQDEEARKAARDEAKDKSKPRGRKAQKPGKVKDGGRLGSTTGAATAEQGDEAGANLKHAPPGDPEARGRGRGRGRGRV